MHTHHAQLLRSQTRDIKSLQELYNVDDSDEVHLIEGQSLGIPEARRIIAEAHLRPTVGGYRLIVVLVDTITVEAQQALLKTLEEPPATTRFLFVIPAHVVLLKTFLSRFSLLADTGTFTTEADSVFDQFMAQSLSDRQMLITERISKKDTTWLESIKTGLAKHVARVGFRNIPQASLVAFILTRLCTRGASNKMLLEALAFTLPPGQIKGVVVH